MFILQNLWRRVSYFGGIYQIMSCVRSEFLREDVLTLKEGWVTQSLVFAPYFCISCKIYDLHATPTGPIFWDIYQRPDIAAQINPMDGLHFHDLLYADDTLLLADNTRLMNKLLEAIEEESLYYNMKLNKDKSPEPPPL